MAWRRCTCTLLIGRDATQQALALAQTPLAPERRRSRAGTGPRRSGTCSRRTAIPSSRTCCSCGKGATRHTDTSSGVCRGGTISRHLAAPVPGNTQSLSCAGTAPTPDTCTERMISRPMPLLPPRTGQQAAPASYAFPSGTPRGCVQALEGTVRGRGCRYRVSTKWRSLEFVFLPAQ